MLPSESTEVTIYFRTSYNTYLGQQLFVIGDHPLLGSWRREKALEMRYFKKEDNTLNWIGKVSFRKPIDSTLTIEYKYILLTSAADPNFLNGQKSDVRLEKEAEVCWDAGPNRVLTVGKVSNSSPFVITTSDLFQPQMEMLQYVFLKNTFRDVIYRHDINHGHEALVNKTKDFMVNVRFRVLPLQLPPNYSVCITGDSPIFDSWTKYEPMHQIDKNYYEFSIDLPRNAPPFDYKYLILSDDGKVVKWEHRGNRKFVMPERPTTCLVLHDWLLQLPIQKFHGTGILAALFSIRSRQSYQGIGEYMDLKLLIDWAVQANLLLIQMLPMHDTIFSLDGLETNPSMQVSAFAFNPVYLSLRCVKGFSGIKTMRRTDFKSVYVAKIACLREIFDKLDRAELRADPMFIEYVTKNYKWLQSYCYWAALRDDWISKHPQSERKEGDKPEFPPINEVHLFSILNVDGQEETEIEKGCLFNAWVQYQCHLQLSDVAKYAQEKRIVLSCCLTIGQRYGSADTWAHPEMFNVKYSIGAPPDIFSFHGQNWWYPSYNWDEMKKTNYMWLHEQICHHENYFRAALFDHPLGLFRCWIIPSDIENPLLGHYEPSIPIDVKDLNDLQLKDISRFCRPIFPIIDVLSFGLPEKTKERIINKLAVCEGGIWRFRAQFETDTAVKNALNELSDGLDMQQKLQFSLAEKILLAQYESVCLIPDREQPHRKYYPRFSMIDSTIFKLLSERDAQILYKLFVDFYYRTNISLWHENGAQNLSVLASSSMQFFGYDLGVTLNDEEKLLNRSGICSYRVQRIPRESSQRFDQTSSFPYLSICTPSPHDLPHLAVWWKQEQADAQLFYHQILKMSGAAPLQINSDIVRGICKQNLESDSMWCIFVFEDLFGLSSEFTANMSDNWINDPSSATKGKYRLGITLDDLLEHKAWTESIVELVEMSKRGRSVDSGFPEISE